MQEEIKSYLKEIDRLAQRLAEEKNKLQIEKENANNVRNEFKLLVKSFRTDKESRWLVSYYQELNNELKTQYDQLNIVVGNYRDHFSMFGTFYTDFIEIIGRDKFNQLKEERYGKDTDEVTRADGRRPVL